MTLKVKPEIAVDIPESDLELGLPEKMEAAATTAAELAEHGLDLEVTKEDQENAAKLVAAYAEDPEGTSKKVTLKRAATLTPASLIMTDKILKEFGQSVVESSLHIRHMVTNKLVLESENPDPRIRMRALELLGKISDVGLFSEKSEVTITHQSTDDLREKLKGKLEKLVAGEVVEEAVVVDVDEELGIEDYDD
jgi:hypothetical protein|tara:strand:- start:466 stop:1047 length:582 start_codon:yes stop_codon:yes gene_type:complete